jgi:hypothetical protein
VARGFVTKREFAEVDASTERSRRGPLFPILASISLFIAPILGAPAALTSFMLFDATGTEAAPTWVWVSFYGIWAFEFMTLLAVPGVWIAWALTRNRRITVLLLVTLSPLVPLAVLAFGLILGA